MAVVGAGGEARGKKNVDGRWCPPPASSLSPSLFLLTCMFVRSAVDSVSVSVGRPYPSSLPSYYPLLPLLPCVLSNPSLPPSHTSFFEGKRKERERVVCFFSKRVKEREDGGGGAHY